MTTDHLDHPPIDEDDEPSFDEFHVLGACQCGDPDLPPILLHPGLTWCRQCEGYTSLEAFEPARWFDPDRPLLAVTTDADSTTVTVRGFPIVVEGPQTVAAALTWDGKVRVDIAGDVEQQVSVDLNFAGGIFITRFANPLASRR